MAGAVFFLALLTQFTNEPWMIYRLNTSLRKFSIRPHTEGTSPRSGDDQRLDGSVIDNGIGAALAGSMRLDALSTVLAYSDVMADSSGIHTTSIT